jgi:diguanylate cyclase (GGDEF)-like protein
MNITTAYRSVFREQVKVFREALARFRFWLDLAALLGMAASIFAYASTEQAMTMAVASAAAAVAVSYLVARLASVNLGSNNPTVLSELAALRQQNEAITLALNSMSQGLCMFDGNKDLVVCNRRYAELYAIDQELVQPGTPFVEIVSNRVHSGHFAVGDPDAYIRERIAAVEERTPSVKVQQLTDGRSIAISHRPLPGGAWVATHDDITEIRRIEAQVARMAHYDALTDLPNRVRLREELDRALGRAKRDEQLWLLCLDLDNFKPVNDTLGHPIGDGLLREVAERLREITRECDIVARLGGDEFAILQGGIKDPEQAKALAERVIEILGVPYEIEGHQIVIGTSIGIAVAPTDSDDVDELLKRADLALYRAKSEGGSTYRFFEPDMDAWMQARRALELDLRKAVANDELEVHYQPLVNIVENRISGFEALIRWSHPVRGNVPPSEFIPLSEEIGLIGRIGAWVLKTACKEAATWPKDLRLAVNLSPAQFKGCALVLDVMAALGSSGFPANRLELEITETVMLQDTGQTVATLHSLRGLGVRISMDDFGTGYSSLSFLRKFPFDRIKIDRSFVKDMLDQEDSQAIVTAMFGLGNSLGMATTAEGVETADQLARLREDGCQEVQGYLFSPARAACEIPGLLASINRKDTSSVA